MGVILLLAFLVLVQASEAVVYQVSNSAGSTRFNEVGAEYARQTLPSASGFIWSTFQQNSPADCKNVQQVSLSVESISGVAYTAGDQIPLSASYVQGYTGDVRREVTGVVYHEMTHVWQWNGNGKAPGGLIEGIADFVRLKAGYALSHWVKPGQGNSWDQGYNVPLIFSTTATDSVAASWLSSMPSSGSDTLSVISMTC